MVLLDGVRASRLGISRLSQLHEPIGRCAKHGHDHERDDHPWRPFPFAPCRAFWRSFHHNGRLQQHASVLYTYSGQHARSAGGYPIDGKGDPFISGNERVDR